METILTKLNLTKVSEITNQQLLELYLSVSRAWEGSLREDQTLTVEEALHTLREVRDLAHNRKLRRLHLMAHELLWEIALRQDEPHDGNAENFMHSGVAEERLEDQGLMVM